MKIFSCLLLLLSSVFLDFKFLFKFKHGIKKLRGPIAKSKEKLILFYMDFRVVVGGRGAGVVLPLSVLLRTQ